VAGDCYGRAVDLLVSYKPGLTGSNQSARHGLLEPAEKYFFLVAIILDFRLYFASLFQAVLAIKRGRRSSWPERRPSNFNCSLE